MYKHDLRHTKNEHARTFGSITPSQICVNKERRNSNTEEDQEVTHQKQYLVEYEPFITERWALPIFRQIKDRDILMTKDVPRNNFLDASCEICCDPCTKEEKVQPTTDLYQCSVCYRTYHWQCLKRLACYTKNQRAEIIADDNWACPACVGMIPTQQ